MSQRDDSENDIWEYKPLGKKKKKRESLSAGPTVAKRRCTTSKKTPKTSSVSQKDIHEAGGDISVNVVTKDHHLPSPKTSDTLKTHNEANGLFSEDFCPICQMPFSILVVQSQRWHVSECLDTPRDSCKECPDGLNCSSSIPSHYKKFNHTLLAHNRANSDDFFTPSQPAETSGEKSYRVLPELLNNKVDDSSFEISQENPQIMSSLTNHTDSPVSNHTGTPPSKVANSLQFLRSPGPEDLKKKKGWSSSTKGQKAISASQESRTEVSSTPLQENSVQASEGLSKCDFSPHHDEAISYSPLSELPVEAEVTKSEPRKALFKSNAFENDSGSDSMVLFSSEDELLTEFIDDLESRSSQAPDAFLSNIQVETVTSLATTQLTTSSDATDRIDSTGEDRKLISLQSPQSLVLERLRETLQKAEQLSSHQLPSSQIMAPQKGLGKPGQAPGLLKQTDIGVFFGLKPLKEKEKEAARGPEELTTAGKTAPPQNQRKERQRRERRGRQRKTDAPVGSSQDAETDAGEAADAQGKRERRGTREFRRRRWNRWHTADGVEELPRCPFYKKIPGTTFAIDAFRYGEIEGITAYFLTHFHSDHYGGLTKNSTLPIYCNKITGNLVRSKLRVAEKYVHILPMNTLVTVDTVRVILLDANHCPGAAMLLFFLPDGQTVLHTGDFRADPSMETYPELLNCRVQSLYLDTTYCSPEYTFPRQQEVISFAASTAFELVTLHPRTLVVCGSYSVGKEKVFLALAEVLGSKVCLSRDKYNTMCCLESDQIKQSLTTDWKAAKVHVLPMMQLTFKKLEDHLARFPAQYDQVVAFKPTGWTFSQGTGSVADIEPQVCGRVSIYGIPYSEHSSFLELKRFVQWLQPLKIIPTVNNGSWASRKAMEKCFSEWRSEAKVRQFPVT